MEKEQKKERILLGKDELTAKLSGLLSNPDNSLTQCVLEESRDSTQIRVVIKHKPENHGLLKELKELKDKLTREGEEKREQEVRNEAFLKRIEEKKKENDEFFKQIENARKENRELSNKVDKLEQQLLKQAKK